MNREVELYFDTYIPKKIKAEAIINSVVLSRQTKYFFEPFSSHPYKVFYICINNLKYFGRKYLPDASIKQLINSEGGSKKNFSDERYAALSSRPYNEITTNMIYGIEDKTQLIQEGIFVSYYPLTPGEKLYLFDKIKKNKRVDIIFPYPKISNMKEVVANMSYWDSLAKHVDILDDDEECLRSYTINTHLYHYDLKNKIIYDPACTSGKFLSSIKSRYPDTKIIGQDINEKMVNIAKNCLDEVYLCDASLPILGDEFADIIFIRFLNHGVVSTKNAYLLFSKIVNRCKTNGTIILCGHMPILLNVNLFNKNELKIVQKIAYCEKHNSIFQYYVLKKLNFVHNGVLGSMSRVE
jgi:hypothetical protein